MNAVLLKQSFELVAPRKEEFAYSFYLRLFSDHPQVRSLFAQTDMKKQESALISAVALVVAGVERGDNLVPILQQLGAKHHHYGVTADHYPLVGAALLDTFSEHLGTAFTNAMRDSWIQAFEVISTHMLAGAQQSTSTS